MRFKDAAAQPTQTSSELGRRGWRHKSATFFSSSRKSSGKRRRQVKGGWKSPNPQGALTVRKSRCAAFCVEKTGENATIYVSLHLAHYMSNSNETALENMPIPKEKS